MHGVVPSSTPRSDGARDAPPSDFEDAPYGHACADGPRSANHRREAVRRTSSSAPCSALIAPCRTSRPGGAFSEPTLGAPVLAGGATLYLASVAKTPNGVAEPCVTLCGTARKHGVPAVMVNSVGTCEGRTAGGCSMAIDPSGRLLVQLGDSDEGLLIYDTEARTAIAFLTDSEILRQSST